MKRTPFTASASALAVLLGVALAACTTPEPIATPNSAAASNPSAPEALAPLPAALHAEGMPKLTLRELQATQHYGRVEGWALQDWHPTQARLLLSRREGSVAQLFVLDEALGTARSVTSGNAPARQGQFAGADRIIFERDQGGSEAHQVYLQALVNGPSAAGSNPAANAVALMGPGERHDLVALLPKQAAALVVSVPLDARAGAAEDGAAPAPNPASTANSSARPLNTRLSRVDLGIGTTPGSAPGPAHPVLALPGMGWYEFRPSPDESRVALTRYLSANESQLWMLELASGRLQQVMPAPHDTAAPKAVWRVQAWAADGQSLFLLSDRAGEFKELVRLPLTMAPSTHSDPLAQAAAAGPVQRLSAHIPWDIDSAALSADGRWLAARANVDGRDELRLFNALTGQEVKSGEAGWPARQTLPAGRISRVVFHPKLPLLAMMVSSAQSPSHVHVLNFESGHVQAWTRTRDTDGASRAGANAGPNAGTGVNLAELQEPSIVRWPSFDGRSISGILHSPPARFAGKRPVVMVMHGGPESQAKTGWAGRLNVFTQALGVAVLEPNVRGSSGYGKTFLALDNGRLREDSVKDMGAALDWIAQQPNLDASRVMVIGGSYGGYMALAASVHYGHRIAGAMSSVGISNFVSFLERTESYRRDLRRVEYGDERDPAMREFLHRISPLTNAHKIIKPLFVVQGKNDPRVPYTESEQIVRNLQARGAPVWYLLANNEGHGFARRENSDYYFAALVRFVKERLQP